MLHALIALIALQHLAFLVLEMFLWTKPIGLKIFQQKLEQAQLSRTLAANQGLYNGFLAAGLVWSLISNNPILGQSLAQFFLGCVAIAGIFGGFTVNRRILLYKLSQPSLDCAHLLFFNL